MANNEQKKLKAMVDIRVYWEEDNGTRHDVARADVHGPIENSPTADVVGAIAASAMEELAGKVGVDE